MESLDKIRLEDEETLYNAYLDDAGISEKASIGVIVIQDSYEVFVDEWHKGATSYFATFEDALDYCKQEYPDANWEVMH